LFGAKTALHAAAVVQVWLDARGIQVILHILYSPELTSAHFFLFTMLKKELTDCTLMPMTIKTTLYGVNWSVATKEYAVAFMKEIE